VRTRSRSAARSTSDRATARLLAALGDGSPVPEAAPKSDVDGETSAPSTAFGRHRAHASTSDDSPPIPVRSPRLTRAAERWLPEGIRGARVDPGRRGAAALGGVVLLAALAVSLLVWRARPQAEVVRPPPVVVAAPGPSASAAASAVTPTGGGQLVVAVTGRIRRPGVVTLPAGARVIDAVRAAGGALPGADLALLNLARKLGDGELVVVGVPGAASDPAGDSGPAAASGSAGTGGKVDLNTATLEQLDGLPGIGPVLAQRILDWRAEHGRFASVDELQDVPGIGESKFGQLRDKVRV
jgi:competence protein ComEA